MVRLGVHPERRYPNVSSGSLETEKPEIFPVEVVNEADFVERFGHHSFYEFHSFGNTFKVYKGLKREDEDVVIKTAGVDRLADAGVEVLAVSRLRRGAGEDGAVVIAHCKDCSLRGGIQVAEKKVPGRAFNELRPLVVKNPKLLLDFIKLGEQELQYIHKKGIAVGEVKLANFVGYVKTEQQKLTFDNLMRAYESLQEGRSYPDLLLVFVLSNGEIQASLERFKKTSDYEEKKELEETIMELVNQLLRYLEPYKDEYSPSSLKELKNVDFGQAVVIPDDKQLEAADNEIVKLREGLYHLKQMVYIFSDTRKISLDIGAESVIEDLETSTRVVFMFIESMKQMLDSNDLPKERQSLSSQFREVKDVLKAIISHVSPREDIEEIMQAFSNLIDRMESKGGFSYSGRSRLMQTLGDSNEQSVRNKINAVATFLSNTFGTYDPEEGALILNDDIQAVRAYFKNPNSIKQRVASALGVDSLLNFCVYGCDNGVSISLLPIDPYLRQEYRAFFSSLFTQLDNYAQAVVRGKVSLEEDPLRNWRIRNFFKTKLIEAQIRDWKDFLERILKIKSDWLAQQSVPPKISREIDKEVTKLRTMLEKMNKALVSQREVSSGGRAFKVLSNAGIRLFERAAVD